MAEMTMPDAARRRADLIELLQPVHLGSEAAAVMVEVHGWKVVGGLADCHRRRASQDAAVKERGVWGQRAGCGEAVTGLGRQGRGRLWICLGGPRRARFAVHGWMRLKAAIFAMFFDTILLRYGVLVCLYMS